MLALLDAAFAAWLLTRARGWLRFPLAVLFLVCSLGHFQSYVEVAIVLVMLALYRELLAGKSPATVFRSGIAAVATLLVAGLCYYVAVHIVWSATGIEPSTQYNSLQNINKIAESSIPVLLARTWLFFFDSLARPNITNSSLTGAFYLILGVYILAQTVLMIRKRRLEKQSVALLLLLLVLFPLGCNCVFFLSNGLKHSLMTYSFVFFDVWALTLYDLAKENNNSQEETSDRDLSIVSESKAWLKSYAVPALCGLLILNRILFANALYLKFDLQDRATLSLMTRMVDRIEQTPGYKIGETPVLIVRHIDQNPCIRRTNNFGMLNDLFLRGHRSSVTYPETFENYFEYVLNYPIQYVPREKMTEYIEKLGVEAIQKMPIFPERGGVALIDGVLVVRLSENVEVTEDADW